MIVKHRPGFKVVYFHNSDLESELKSAVVSLCAGRLERGFLEYLIRTKRR